MKDNSHYTLILALADIIVGKQIDTKKVTKSLELICNSFSFECALVYEVDQYNHFNLTENYSLNDIKLCNSFNAYEIESDFQKQLAHQKIIYLNKNKNYKPCEIDFMNIFHAESLIGISVIDENFNNYGFILFLNTTSRKIDFSDSELNTLCIVLSLLEKYLSVRIHRNKVFFTQTALESIINNTGIDIYVIDFYTYDIIYVNKSMAEPYGGISQFWVRNAGRFFSLGRHLIVSFAHKKILLMKTATLQEYIPGIIKDLLMEHGLEYLVQLSDGLMVVLLILLVVQI